jgi:hypothetical protein
MLKRTSRPFQTHQGTSRVGLVWGSQNLMSMKLPSQVLGAALKGMDLLSVLRL